MGARRARVKAEAFYCIFGVFLFLKEVLFYGVLGVVLFLALVGMENMDIPWGLLSLMGLVFAALLEWFLILHMRGWRDGVVTRCLWLLKGVVFCAVVGAIFFCLRLGAEKLGLSGLWFAKDWVFFVICGLILPVVSMGARRARVKAEAFYCIFGVFLFLKEVLFYGVLGVVLFLALVGMENMDIPWGLLSLMGLVFAALLEWFLILHMRGWRDGVVTRCLWLLKGVVFCAVVGAIFFCLRLGAEKLGLSGLWFAKDWVFFVICGLILPVVSMGARRARVKAEAFYCIFGVFLFLKEVLFYGVLGVVLFLALVGMENMDIPWGLLSLMGLVFAALLEWFLILHMRGWRDGVVTRCLWLLKGVVFCAVVGAIFFCLRLGAEKLGLSGLWFAKDWVFFVICGLILPVVSMGAGRVRVKAEAFLKRVGFMGHYR